MICWAAPVGLVEGDHSDAIVLPSQLLVKHDTASNLLDARHQPTIQYSTAQ